VRRVPERDRRPISTPIAREKEDSDYVERMSGGIHASYPSRRRPADRSDDRPVRRPNTKKR